MAFIGPHEFFSPYPNSPYPCHKPYIHGPIDGGVYIPATDGHGLGKRVEVDRIGYTKRMVDACTALADMIRLDMPNLTELRLFTYNLGDNGCFEHVLAEEFGRKHIFPSIKALWLKAEAALPAILFSFPNLEAICLSRWNIGNWDLKFVEPEELRNYQRISGLPVDGILELQNSKHYIPILKLKNLRLLGHMHLHCSSGLWFGDFLRRK